MRDDPIDGPHPTLRIQLPSMRRSYRGLDRGLRDDIGPLLARIEREVPASERKYVVNLEFLNGNPYFGLFVANVNADMVDRFDIDLFQSSAAQLRRDVVTVRQDKLQLVTESAEATQRLARHYLQLHAVSPNRAA